MSIGEEQEDVGDYSTRSQREQGDPNAPRTLPCAHGDSAGERCSKVWITAALEAQNFSSFPSQGKSCETRNVLVKTDMHNIVIQSLFSS